MENLTPLAKIPLADCDSQAIYVKLELLHPFGSHKARSVKGILDEYEQAGRLTPGSGQVIVDSSGGNLAQSMALEARYRGYKPYACIVRTYSDEKKKMFSSLGGTLIPQIEGLTAVETIQEWIADNENIKPVYLNQFLNDANLRAHQGQTGVEIANQIRLYTNARPKTLPVVLVGGIGSGASLIGIGLTLKKHFGETNVKVFAVQPDGCDFEKNIFVPHKIQGTGLMKTRFQKLHPEILDGYLPVTFDQALAGIDWLFRRGRVFAGVSSGANIAATLRLANNSGTYVTIAYDSGMHYLDDINGQ